MPGQQWGAAVNSAVLGALAVGVCAVALAFGQTVYRIGRIRRWSRFGVQKGAGRAAVDPDPVRAGFRRSGLRREATRRGDAFGDKDLALLCVEVASRLRAGSPVEDAWRSSWQRLRRTQVPPAITADGVPVAIHSLASAGTRVGLAAKKEGLALKRAVASTDATELRIERGREQAVRRAARSIVSACRFSHRCGAPLADVLDSVADGIDEAEAARDARAVAGAGAHTSARILTALPVVGLCAAQVLGAQPFVRFADGSIGTIALIIGLTCILAAHVLSARMIRWAEQVDEAEYVGPILCDLASAGLTAGASVPGVLEALGEATQCSELSRCGRELRLGMGWERAWEEVPPRHRILANALEPAWCDGASPIPLLTRSAAQVRARRQTHARMQAEKLGVRLVVPLGALLLPAFVALGVVPAVLFLLENGFEALIP